MDTHTIFWSMMFVAVVFLWLGMRRAHRLEEEADEMVMKAFWPEEYREKFPDKDAP